MRLRHRALPSLGEQQLINSEFKLLCESLGFYTSKHIVDYIKHFTTQQLAIRPVDYWRNGKANEVFQIPEYILVEMQKLQQRQFQLVKRESDKLLTGEPITYKYMFKDPEKMWFVYPELDGLPVSFLNQILIRLNVHLDYFENYERG